MAFFALTLFFAAVWFIYIICVVSHRLFFSPLAHFPGPRLAAATTLYQFYFDVVRKGNYTFHIAALHKKYGPIIRITPWELHIDDPAFYDQLYVFGNVRKVERYDQFIQGIDYEGSHLLTKAHDLHRRRRKPFEPYFSLSSVQQLEPMVWELCAKLCNRLQQHKALGKVARLDHAFVAYAGDVIQKVCCSDSSESLLDHQDFAPHWFNMFQSIIKSVPLMATFPWLVKILGAFPTESLACFIPGGKEFLQYKAHAVKHIEDAKADKALAEKYGSQTNLKTSVFRSVISSDLPDEELSTARLANEAQVIFGAATATTARPLDFVSYFILSNPAILSRLQDELREPMKDYPHRVPSLVELQKLPYLQALIKEALRLSYGVMHRLPHCAPDVAIQYREWSIPAGTAVGMSAYMMHTNPQIFPDPFKFNPERWLGNYNPLMDKYLVPFSRGSRACLGKNLAIAEINIALAAIYQPGGLSLHLFETDESDVQQVHDFALPMPRLDTKGVRVTVA